MRKIKLHEWMLLVGLAVAGIFLWCHFSLPRYQSIDLTVSQAKAIDIAKAYLISERGVNANDYIAGCVFNVDDGADRYLQKTLGMAGSREWLQRTNYDLFFWSVRFFKEKVKEEYSIHISSKTGRVIRFYHALEQTAMRPDIGKEPGRQKAWDTLQKTFGFDSDGFSPHGEYVSKLDKRQDYQFSWEDNTVAIPWDPALGGGLAKLVSSVTVSGDDVLAFNRGDLDIPEGFGRYTESLRQTGHNLTMLFRILYLALLTLAIMLVVNRKHHIVPRLVRNYYAAIAAVLFMLMVIDFFNSYQQLLFQYPTTQSFWNYAVRELIQALVNPFFIVVGLVLPALSGEALRYEIAPRNKSAGFLSSILSSFYTTSVGHQILIGYIGACLLMGMQGYIFHVGYTYWGVWDEFSWLAQSSTKIFPAFSAILAGFHAAFAEEVMFRLFAINLLRRYGGGIIIAVVVSSVVWGFGHTGYAIYPMWFRGIEVTILGIILGVFYLRYGLLSVIVAHYLMDAFLNVMPYLLKGPSSPNYIVSLLVIGFPVVFAIAAMVMRKSEKERPLTLKLTPQQQFNYALLTDLKCGKIPNDLVKLKQDLLKHGWDPAVVERVFEK